MAHSISPQLHEAAYHALGLTQWSYGRAEVSEPAFPAFLAGLDDQWRGLSLTMPLKEVVFSLGLPTSDEAERVGAANTLVCRDGAWVGHNTDIHGVVEALRSGGVSAGPDARSVDGVEVLVLGSGATARSVLAALHRIGVRSVEIAVRDEARPRTLALGRALGMSVRTSSLVDAAPRLLTTPVVVSTLPPAGGDAVARMLDAGARGVLLDVVYAGWPTPLAEVFSARGGRVVSGFEMVLHQAGEQVRLMTGLEAPLEAMRAAGLQAMAASARS